MEGGGSEEGSEEGSTERYSMSEWTDETKSELG